MSQTIVITGASSGMGRAAALLFARKGWRVAATMRSPESAGELAQTPGCRLYALDVTKPESVAAATDAILRDLGQVDVVVNNAGYALSCVFESATPEQIQRQFDTNVFGLMHVTRAFLPHFRARRAGRFVNISSIGGLTTTPLASLYHASKWAVEGFSEALRYELNPLGIEVKLVEPGRTQTDFFGRSQERVPVAPDSDYSPTVERIRAALSQAWDPAKLSSADAIAEIIYQAATDSSPRIRYVAGADAVERYQHRLQHGDEASYERMRQQLLG